MAKSASPPSAKTDPRTEIVEALMRLAADRAWDDIELADIAREAGLPLASLRDHFPSKGAMLAGFGRMIDSVVLAGTSDDLDGEPVHERLFDVMMRRLDALTPYKPALRALVPVVRRDPLMLAALNGAALNSWRYMLASAQVNTEDALGGVRVQGAVLMFTRVVDVWLHDDEPGLARTMAALDRELRSGGKVMRRIEDVHRLTAPLRGLLRAVCNAGPGQRRRSRSAETDDGHAAAI